jgi:uncharacterized protein YbjT (DUF2867 family)
MKTDTLTLVYGATGTQGSAVAKQLAGAGRRLRVLARDERKAEPWRQLGAEIALGDLSDPASLRAAHRGVDTVLLHLPLQFNFDLYETYGRHAVDAAREAGVRLLVLNTSSFVGAGTAVGVHRARRAVVDYLRASGVPSVVLRPTFYTDSFIGPLMKPGIVREGVVAFPLRADFRASWISADEAARFSVAALDRPDLAGSQVDIGGPEALNGTDIAERFSAAFGRPVAYRAVSPDEHERTLASLFGTVVACEITAEIRWVASRPDAAVDMAATARQFGVEQVPLRQWIEQQDWSLAA